MNRKPKIFVTRKLPDNVEARLIRGYDVTFNPQDRRYSGDELVRLAADHDAILCCHTEQFNAEVIKALPDSIKAIANFSVGVDHCDLQAAKEKSIIVTNTPDVLSDATAEIAILCMLGAARRAGEGIHMVSNDQWHDWNPTFMLGRQVTGKRLGIIGMGRVGQVTARRARGFDMQIHYHNRQPLDAQAEQGAIYHESLQSLLSVSDVLSVHCPATPASVGLINAKTLAELPDGAIFVNTARGAVVNDDDLIAALTSGKIAAAGLDVFNGEPSHIHPQYRALKNVDAIFKGEAPADRVA